MSAGTAWRSPRSLLLFAIALSTALHAFWFLHSTTKTTPDSVEYDAAARGVLAGRGFVDPHGQPDLLRTPVYPLWLAATGGASHPLLATAIQHLLGIALVPFVFVLVRDRWNARAAAAAALLVAADLSLVTASDLVMTETLFTALLLLLVWIVTRPAITTTAALMLGLLSGVLTLTRPIAIFLPLALVWVLRRNGRTLVALILSAALLPGLWILRNERLGGIATVSIVGAKNALYWRGAGTLAMHEAPYVAAPWTSERDRRWLRRTFELQIPLQREVSSRSGGDLRLSHRVENEQAFRIVRSHPLAALLGAWSGAYHMLFDHGAEFIAAFGMIGGWGWSALISAHGWLELLGTFAALSALRRISDPRRNLIIAAIVVLGYFVLLSAGPEAYAYAFRFRAPIAPLLAVLCAVGWDAVVNQLSERRGWLRKNRGV